MQALMLGAAAGPLTGQDQERFAILIRAGYKAWSEFHDRFSEEQAKIKALDPGLAAWDDLDVFLREYAEARLAEGFCAQRFAFREGSVERVLEPARVITFDGSTFFACGDYSGAPVFGPEGELAAPIGLNSSPVTQALRRLAFPGASTGAAHVRWPSSHPMPIELPAPFGVLVLLRQTLQSQQGNWAELMTALHCWAIPRDGDAVPLDGQLRATILRGLFAATIRAKPEEDTILLDRLVVEEGERISALRRISEADHARQVRHAVLPLFAAVVGPAA